MLLFYEFQIAPIYSLKYFLLISVLLYKSFYLKDLCFFRLCHLASESVSNTHGEHYVRA